MKLREIEPSGHRVLVKPDDFEKVSEGGIVLPSNDSERKSDAQVIGTLVKIGPNAWKDFSDGTPWAAEGDRVMYAKYAGYVVEIDGEKHRVMNDEDVTAIVRA